MRAVHDQRALERENLQNPAKKNNWHAPVAAPTPDVDEFDFFEALDHVKEHGGHSDGILVVMLHVHTLSKHHLVPRCHLGGLADGRPIIGA